MKKLQTYSLLMLLIMISACKEKEEKPVLKKLEATVFETSESGNKLTKLTKFNEPKDTVTKTTSIVLNTKKQYQTITGFGGAFTESSAYLLNKLSKKIET